MLFRRIACAALFLMVAMVPVSALAQTTTGSIEGTILDPDGVPLPGVRVVANSPALIQADMTVYSGANGYFRLALLPSGVYEISIEIDGFRPLQRTDLLVTVGQTTAVNSTLELAGVSETAIVVGEVPIIDARQAKLGFNFTPELMENIPTARNMSGVFSTAPGVESVNNLGGGVQPGTWELQNVLGAGERSSSYRWDGMNTTDPAGQWNTMSQMNYDAVEEIQILKAAKPAEVPFQGGLFNVITKSGGNDFSGTVAGYFANDALQATNTGDFEGDDISNELDQQYELTASLGGKIIRDKLWWYASGRVFDGTSRIFAFPANVKQDVKSFSGKVTWQANQNHRFMASGSAWDDNVSHYFFGYSPALALNEQASAVRPRDSQAIGGQWSGVLSDTVIAEANFNYTQDDFDQGLSVGGRRAIVNLATGVRADSAGTSAGGIRDQDNDFWNFRADVSWYVPDAAGQHDFKFGGEYMPTRTMLGFDEPEGHQLHTLPPGTPGRKFAVRLLNTPTTAIWDNDLTALYAQDSWTIADRLTLNVGLRYMHTRAYSPEQPSGGGPWADTALVNRFPEMAYALHDPVDLVTWDTVDPRFALTYQVDSAARTILRFGASRYYQNLDSFKFFVASPAFPMTWVTLWNDANDDFEYQVGEEGFLLFSFGGSLNSVDPNLRRPYTDEFVFGASHEITSDIQISANAIFRQDRDLGATEDIGDTRYTPVDVLDPGPDGIPGTGDDATITVYEQDADTIGNNRLQITNPEGAKRDYKGLEITASKRFRNNWQGVASLVWSEMAVTQSTLALGVLGTFDSPNGAINALGLDEANQTVQVKLQGTYMFDFGLGVSGLYRFRTGTPYTRELAVSGLNQGTFNVRAEPRGSSRPDSISTLDLRFEQRFFAPAQLGLIVDVFNLFNSNASVDEGHITSFNYGETLSVLSPRVVRLGLRYTW